MKKLSYVVSALFGVVIAASFFVSCSEDSGDNVSVPRFSGIEFSRETLYAGETVNATAVQYKKGKRLDRTTYIWSCSSSEAEVSGGKSGVFYESDKSDPSCQVKLPETPGRYTLTLNASYNVSGKIGNSTKTEDLQGHTTVTYTTAPTICNVLIKKEFDVKAK